MVREKGKDMFKVVVTGATGFIGQHLCKFLLNKGIIVYGIGRNRSVLDELEENKKFHGVALEFEGYSKIDKLIRDRDFDCFFHLANYGVNGTDKENYKVQLENTLIACDVVGIANTLGCKRFVFIGSVDEFEACAIPDSQYIEATHSKIYGLAKYTAESIGKILAKRHSMEYVSAILTLTYGEGNNTNILPNVLIKNSFVKGKVDLIEGNNYFDIIYIDEAVEAIFSIAQYGKSMESYYVGHEELRTFKQIVNEINLILDNRVQLEFGKYRDQGKTIDYEIINRKKLSLDTGYVCNVSLEEGISKTYEWLRDMYSNK